MRIKRYVVKIVTKTEEVKILVDAIDKKDAIRKVRYVLNNSTLFDMKNKKYELYSRIWKGD